MKKLQARLFMVLMALFLIVSTSTLAAAQNPLNSPVPETSSQGVYPLLVIIIEIICPLPFTWPVV